MMKKLIGRSDMSCTIFVPWDCNNHCAFCNTKNEYKNSKCTNLDNIQKIKQSIIEVASMPSINAYTFTGGEPFNNPEKLLDMAKACKDAAPDKKVYINTYMPKEFIDSDEYEEFMSSPSIDGISISMPVGQLNFFKHLLDIKEFERVIRFKNKIRINAYVPDDCSLGNLENYLSIVEPFLKEDIHINLRADYNHITPDTLGAVANDRVFNELMEISSDYLGHSGCLVCRTDVFDTPYGLVYYHRGTPVTSLTIGDKLIINDLVIKQTGQLFYDWPEDDWLE